MCVCERQKEREVDMKDQALWSLEKEDLAEEVGGRASRKMNPAYVWGPALFRAVSQAYSL